MNQEFKNSLSVGKRIAVCFQKIIDEIAKEKSLTKNIKYRQIKKILFRQSDNYFGQGFKFDFSFPLYQEKDLPLRFTFNGFGEKEKFANKIRSIFGLFEKKIDLNKAEQILTLLKKEFLTFGLSWPKRAQSPVLKIESEMAGRKKTVILKKICQILGYSLLVKKSFLRKELVAITVGFFSKNDCRLKLYFRLKKIDELDKFNFLSPAVRQRIKGFSKRAPKNNVFYLLSPRLNRLGEIESIKIYLIYETKEFQNRFHIDQRWQDLQRWKIHLTSIGRILGKITDICQKYKLILYPTIVGMETSKIKEKEKMTIYFSIIDFNSYESR